MMKRTLTFLLLFVVILLSDGLSKAYVNAHIPLMGWSSSSYPYGGIAVFQNWHGIDFSINHVTNHGAAWGMFASFQKSLLYFRILVIGALLAYVVFCSFPSSHRHPLSLIIAGASANVLDYFLYGHVIDLFHFKFWGYTYPIFNLADSAIFCGVASLLVLSLMQKLSLKQSV